MQVLTFPMFWTRFADIHVHVSVDFSVTNAGYQMLTYGKIVTCESWGRPDG